MNIQEFAKLLDGRQYGHEITQQEAEQAKELGYVVVFGYSDDNMEFRGAIYDEFSCYDGGTAYIDKNGLIEECECSCKYYQEIKNSSHYIKALWNIDGYCWKYKSSIDYATFEIFEDDEKYCLGIVFDIKSLEDDGE